MRGETLCYNTGTCNVRFADLNFIRPLIVVPTQWLKVDYTGI